MLQISILRPPATWAVCLAAALSFAQTCGAAELFTFHHENVLGTSLELKFDAASPAAATEAEARVLAEIARLAKIFSSYDAESEFSRWQRSAIGRPVVVSRELFDVLAAAERWRSATGGAFHPGAELLSRRWKQAEVSGHEPTSDELAALVARLATQSWQLDEAGRTATRLTDEPLSLNAIAKGTIIDAACVAAVDEARGVRGALVNIGGDLRVAGRLSQPIDVSDPANPAVNVRPLAQIRLHDRAIATSGGYHRGFQVGTRSHSHIFDPRTGRPAEHVLSATVVANNATDADALATSFNVLSLDASVALARSLPGIEYFIVAADGRSVASRGWRSLQAATHAAPITADATLALADEKQPAPAAATPPSATPAAAPLLELVVDFELNRPAGAQYRRPYVAIWLEDKDEFPVRTALLWMQTQQPGPRWHRDLLRWYRQDQIRKLADGTALIGTVSSATRTAGKYQAVFDGKDDAGKPLPPGEYTLFIEAAREHGTYQLIRKKITLGDAPIAKTELKGNVEVSTAAFEYRARADDGAR